ncbi:nuclear transport factor 2 family protein [Myxacorys almedinensis]|uniref:nuclear transport factor 2 family protein n=1 Tax=Myxacorys almedinensis TaxID=2651157 RepID=UPI00192ED11C
MPSIAAPVALVESLQCRMQMWMRATAVCQKQQGNWQILYEHISVPFNPETSQAVFTLNP